MIHSRWIFRPRGAATAATARDDVPPEIACYLHSRSAHLFSILTNGLSLKPCGRLPPGRLIHGGHGAPRIFFVTLPGGGKPIFAASWCALFALDGNARNQAVRRSTGSRAFASGRGIMSYKLYRKRRLRIRSVV